MTSELTHITNLIKSKNEKVKIHVIKKYIKLSLINNMVITLLFLILKVF